MAYSDTDPITPGIELPPAVEPDPMAGRPSAKAVTIGAVCKALEQEFPDISISKIRYLEDQKLVTPRRTQGGYRLYTPTDVSRLRTILRLQRDEFLPLRVIRQELAGAAPNVTPVRADSVPPTRPSASACDARRSRFVIPGRCTHSRMWSRTPAPTATSSASSSTLEW